MVADNLDFSRKVRNSSRKKRDLKETVWNSLGYSYFFGIRDDKIRTYVRLLSSACPSIS